MESTTLGRRVWIKGLAVECPLGKALNDCPLNEARMLPVEQMSHVINNQSSGKVKAVYEHHQHCFRIRSTIRSIRKTGAADRKLKSA